MLKALMYRDMTKCNSKSSDVSFWLLRGKGGVVDENWLELSPLLMHSNDLLYIFLVASA